jgi:hypothetical protein
MNHPGEKTREGESMSMRDNDRWYWKRGQAMAESVLVAGIITSMVAIMSLLLYVFKAYGVRIIDLVSSEYP